MKKLRNNLKFFKEKLPNPIVCIRWNRCWRDKLNFFQFWLLHVGRIFSIQQTESVAVKETSRVDQRSISHLLVSGGTFIHDCGHSVSQNWRLGKQRETLLLILSAAIDVFLSFYPKPKSQWLGGCPINRNLLFKTLSWAIDLKFWTNFQLMFCRHTWWPYFHSDQMSQRSQVSWIVL